MFALFECSHELTLSFLFVITSFTASFTCVIYTPNCGGYPQLLAKPNYIKQKGLWTIKAAQSDQCPFYTSIYSMEIATSLADSDHDMVVRVLR